MPSLSFAGFKPALVHSSVERICSLNQACETLASCLLTFLLRRAGLYNKGLEYLTSSWDERLLHHVACLPVVEGAGFDGEPSACTRDWLCTGTPHPLLSVCMRGRPG